MNRFKNSLSQHRPEEYYPEPKYNKTIQNGSYTPSEMASLAVQGIPISQQTIADSYFADGDFSESVVADPMLSRGYDMNDAFNDEMDAKSKILGAHLNEKRIYGK